MAVKVTGGNPILTGAGQSPVAHTLSTAADLRELATMAAEYWRRMATTAQEHRNTRDALLYTCFAVHGRGYGDLKTLSVRMGVHYNLLNKIIAREGARDLPPVPGDWSKEQYFDAAVESHTRSVQFADEAKIAGQILDQTVRLLHSGGTPLRHLRTWTGVSRNGINNILHR